MTDHHEPKLGGIPQQKESVLPQRMCVIVELNGKIVIENGLCFFKRYSVFPEVLLIISDFGEES